MKAARAARVAVLEDLPNVGAAVAADLRRIGIRTPRALAAERKATLAARTPPKRSPASAAR